MNDGNIPVLTVRGRTLPEAWERSVLATWWEGIQIKTEYDQPHDPPSRDCTMMLIIDDPFAEPRLHRAIPGGLEDLEVYRQEVIDGVHDHWIKPEEGKWAYTYHQRFRAFPATDRTIDQLSVLVDRLVHRTYSRRAQAITWDPESDALLEHPPCLQRIWCRILADQDGNLRLNMNAHWRSRDAYKAAFMNLFALTELQKELAEDVARRIDRPVAVGRFVDMSDSYHIYGSYYGQFEAFLRSVETRTFAERVWNTSFAEEFFALGRERLAREANKNDGR